METLKEYISKIINNYPYHKKTVFKNNSIAKSLRNDFKNVEGIKSHITIDNSLKNKEKINTYRVYGSAGQSKWSFVPWVGIFNKRVSCNAKRGIYIVYLFSPSDGNIYLSLNQGWTYFKDNFKKPKEKIAKKSKLYRKYLKYYNHSMNYDTFDFEMKSSNSIGYPLGNIISIKYNKNELPENKKMLLDLYDMIDVYEDLINKLETYNNGNIEIKDDVKQEHSDIEYLNKNIHNASNLKFNKTEAPKDKKHKLHQKKGNSKKVSKKNYNELNKKRLLLGLYGENIVLYMEKENLKKENRMDLCNKVEHVSQTVGDGLGYDIKSFDKYGNEIFIEVKSTTQNKNSNFLISKNEVDFSEENKHSYRLYRLYGLNLKEEQDKLINYYVVSGNLKDKLHLTPSSYNVTFY